MKPISIALAAVSLSLLCALPGHAGESSYRCTPVNPMFDEFGLHVRGSEVILERNDAFCVLAKDPDYVQSRGPKSQGFVSVEPESKGCRELMKGFHSDFTESATDFVSPVIEQSLLDGTRKGTMSLEMRVAAEGKIDYGLRRGKLEKFECSTTN